MKEKARATEIKTEFLPCKDTSFQATKTIKYPAKKKITQPHKLLFH